MDSLQIDRDVAAARDFCARCGGELSPVMERELRSVLRGEQTHDDVYRRMMAGEFDES